MNFPEIEKHFGPLWKRLCLARSRNLTGQAYLLVGDDIQFLERFAKAWAQTAACKNPLPDGSPCGSCECCRAFEHNTYTECYVVRPQSKSRRITVEDMMEFEHAISLSPRPGFLKIGMLINADRLNDASQNAFLKTLEEPPPGTMLLLLTTSPKMLLPTTKSRCQLLSLRQNRHDYTDLAEQGLFKILSLLYANAGAANGVEAAGRLSALLANQHDLAEEAVPPIDEKVLEGTDAATIKRQLEDERISRVEAEYVRRRDEITDAMNSWFQLQLLLAKDIPPQTLPNQEMFQNVQLRKQPPEAVGRQMDLMAEFLRCLAANVDEKLALDALCLQITQRGQ